MGTEQWMITCEFPCRWAADVPQFYTVKYLLEFKDQLKEEEILTEFRRRFEELIRRPLDGRVIKLECLKTCIVVL